MSAGISGWSDPPEPDDQVLFAEPTTDLAFTGSPVPAKQVEVAAAGSQVEVSPPADSPVPVEAGQPWAGTIIDAAPTTADDIATVVLAVPDVTRLHAGRFGEAATYLPGRRVTGVQVRDEVIEVHVVVAGQIPVRRTAQSIHEAVAALVATPVHVVIEDIAI
ncbi:hypothetical protein [Paractinoplanes rishiriensis]|uniref:Asp23/Gls24 family envelope stress response protein n=1 Tax=Paractinoplanes rishiriensis TaxID=1050105 RepID=A0A919K6J2_9ACTN|nr:hypothetical protein [Actinoplanes rishiriensis]GIF01851.1 hypothetical protein Ari01nite_93150 [Actinoplanes rishiriensis]